MNIIERVKNILITPKTEWEVINAETDSIQTVLTTYVLPLAVVSAVGSLLHGFLFPGYVSLTYFVAMAIVGLISILIAFYISAYVIDALAPSFNSEKNLNKSAQLAAYSWTPTFIAGLLSFIPAIGPLLAIAAWVYGVYLMYLGIGPLKKTPEDKKVVYMLVSFVVLVVVYFVIAAILGMIILSIFGLGVASRFGM